MTSAHYLIGCLQAAIEAGRAILEIYHSDDFHIERKADDSPLTLADRRSHKIIVSHLNSFGVPILSEEGRDIAFEERKGWKTLWVVDPLDGTKEFIKRNGEFTVNIALVDGGRPVLGVVGVPDRGTLYFAERNMGAYRVDDMKFAEGLLAGRYAKKDAATLLKTITDHCARLPLPRPKDMPYTIVASRSHLTKDVQDFVEEARLEHGTVEFLSAGSSLKLCLVAEGRADIYPRLGPTMEWDTAAGQAVVEGAGGRVVRHDTGGPLLYNKENLLNPWFVVTPAER
jgi:3'(2'), 5'-bisphosphate nucleotidase